MLKSEAKLLSEVLSEVVPKQKQEIITSFMNKLAQAQHHKLSIVASTLQG